MAENSMTTTAPGRYASVNGLSMYYEIHGAGRPLVLLHGALSATGTSFGKLLPSLAETRQVIAVEQQAHGRTADIDRPLTYAGMAEDTVALLRHLGIREADIFGYSMGSAVATEIAVRHPDMVRKLVLASPSYTREGAYPEMYEGEENLKPEDLAETPFAEEYARIAPNPEDWPVLVEKVKQLDREFKGWTPEEIRSIRAPALVIIGDSDVVHPEHAVEIFRLLGGGVPGDITGLPVPGSRSSPAPRTSRSPTAPTGCLRWLRSSSTPPCRRAGDDGAAARLMMGIRGEVSHRQPGQAKKVTGSILIEVFYLTYEPMEKVISVLFPGSPSSAP